MRYEIGKPYEWSKGEIVVPVEDQGDYALVKIIKSKRYKNNILTKVLWNQLSERKPEPKLSFIKPQPYNACPTCGTGSQMSGVECPGCGFKEWLKNNWN